MKLPVMRNRAVPGFTTAPQSASVDWADSLRFAVQRAEILPAGLHLWFHDQSSQQMRWDEIGAIVVRRLPADPPFERMVFMDLVPAGTEGEAVSPVRLVPATRANYDALPGGSALSSLENFRRLGSYIRAINPTLRLEEGSAGFFLNGEAPGQFLAITQFAGYDAQYAGTPFEVA